MRIADSIYLDHNASTPVDPTVFEAMKPHFAEAFANPHSSEHALGWAAGRAIEDAAAAFAEMIGCDTDEIIFTSGATEANNIAVLGVANGSIGSKRQKILSTDIEHKSTLNVVRHLASRGFRPVAVTVDSAGTIDSGALEEALDEDVMIVSVGAVNSEVGTIQDIARVGDCATAKGALVHIDAAQAPSAMPLDKLTAYADLISFSGHKMYGPQGVGALYIRRDVQRRLAPVMFGGGQQLGLRPGTLPLALCVGLGQAARLLTDQQVQDAERRRVSRLRDDLVERLRGLPVPIHVNGPAADRRHPGNANIRFDGLAAADILSLAQPQLAASTGSACTSGIPEPSHVLRAIGLTKAQAECSVRFCIGRYTTKSDIDDATTIVFDAVNRLLATKSDWRRRLA